MNDEADWKAILDRRDELKGIRGKRVGGEPDNEAEHFYVCDACGQAVDRRDLFAVLHHEIEGHEPLPVSSAPARRSSSMTLMFPLV
jgi:hypothetical protein